MTKEESLTWVKSLKPGDIVIYSGFGAAGRIQTAKVEKVTPSGIVRTNRGSFKESPWSWSGRVGGYGKTPGEISPPTAELLIEAELQEAEDAAEKKRRDTIYKARNLISELYYNRFRIDYDTAVEIIKVLERCRTA